MKEEVDNVNNEERTEKLLQMTEEQTENSQRQGQEEISWEKMGQDHWISKDRTLLFNVHEDEGTTSRLHSMENSLRKRHWTCCITDCRINEHEVLLVFWDTDERSIFPTCLKCTLPLALHFPVVIYTWHEGSCLALIHYFFVCLSFWVPGNCLVKKVKGQI